MITYNSEKNTHTQKKRNPKKQTKNQNKQTNKTPPNPKKWLNLTKLPNT